MGRAERAISAPVARAITKCERTARKELCTVTTVERVISGGQTGADRGGLDAAIDLGLSHGGFCPKGRRAEDGTIPKRYKLEETASADYADRTRKNVKTAD